MALQTYGEQLEQVQIAIQKVLAGQRYEINGRLVWRADLEFLNKRERELISLVEIHGPDGITGTTTSRGAVKVSFVDA